MYASDAEADDTTPVAIPSLAGLAIVIAVGVTLVFGFLPVDPRALGARRRARHRRGFVRLMGPSGPRSGNHERVGCASTPQGRAALLVAR